MADSTAQSTNVPAFDPGTATNDTHNDDKVYVNLRYKFDPRAVKPPEFPAEMSVYATPSAKERLIKSAAGTAGTGTIVASLGRSIQLQNSICPIKGPLLPEAEGNTKHYQWKEWRKQTDKQWGGGVDDYSNRTRGKTGLEMIQVAEPSEDWQKELGVSLVPMDEVYDAEREGKRRRVGLDGLVSFDAEPARPSFRSRASLVIPTLEGAGPASSWDFIPPPTVPEDDASNLT
jgi:hypothetical protein